MPSISHLPQSWSGEREREGEGGREREREGEKGRDR